MHDRIDAWVRIASLLPVVVGLSSVAASACLLIWLHRLAERDRKMLLPRQLWHLALADLTHTAIAIPWHALDCLNTLFGLGVDASPVLDTICVVSHWGNLPFMVSVLLEVHISLASVAVIYRWNAAIRALVWGLFLVWPFGFLFGLWVPVLGHAFWDPLVGMCGREDNLGETVKVIVMSSSFLTCLVVYTAGFCHGICTRGARVQVRVWRQGRLFVGAAALGWGPFIGWNIASLNKLPKPSEWTAQLQIIFYIVFAFLLSDGLLNAIVYAWESRFVRRARRRDSFQESARSRVDTQDSYGLQFREATPRHDTSFVVAFDPVDEVMDVDRQTQQAFDTSEQETQEIEAARTAAEFALRDGEQAERDAVVEAMWASLSSSR